MFFGLTTKYRHANINQHLHASMGNNYLMVNKVSRNHIWQLNKHNDSSNVYTIQEHKMGKVNWHGINIVLECSKWNHSLSLRLLFHNHPPLHLCLLSASFLWSFDVQFRLSLIPLTRLVEGMKRSKLRHLERHWWFTCRVGFKYSTWFHYR